MNSLYMFLIFAKFGLFAVGGGYVIIPLLYDTFVHQMAILSAPAFGNLMSLAQMTPGPVTINIATYVGYTQTGILGAIIASLGLIFPSFFLTGLAVFFLRKYQDSWIVQGFLKGTRLVSFVMIMYAVFLFLNMSVFSGGFSLSDILRSLLKEKWLVLSNWSFHPLEAMIFICSLYLVIQGVSTTKILILSIVIGYGLSFL